ncbi:LysR family transcriptional regulator [Pyxidicoccus fallax]|uniref:LysR family transcriptional regulator n=1 Tax=Pyxidicoccus fallax TaxID=394095 RepID=A0A848LCJ0_9BACT|nr:LysR family transcriptional regulator [Pyxidicoccus fallax]
MESLRVFVEVVRAGSLSAAARQLGVATSAVSKRLAQMEKGLGVPLLVRSSRSMRLTEAGQALAERAPSALKEVDDVFASARELGTATMGAVRVSAPVTLTEMHVAPLTADFLQAEPSMRVELVVDDRFVDPVKDGFDLVIRSGPATHVSLVVKKLARDARVLCASPAYLARAGTPTTPEDLSRHNCMRHALNDSSGRWELNVDGRIRTVPVRSNLRLNHGGALKAALLRGLGIGYLPLFVVQDELDRGELVRVLPEVVVEAPPFLIALHPYGRRPPRRVHSYLEYLSTHLPQRMGQSPLLR